MMKIDALGFLDQLQSPADGVALIDEICALFFPRTLAQTKKTALLDTLTDGLPVFEWTLQYNEYQANIGDPTYEEPVKTVFEKVLSQLFKFPEFQTC